MWSPRRGARAGSGGGRRLRVLRARAARRRVGMARDRAAQAPPASPNNPGRAALRCSVLLHRRSARAPNSRPGKHVKYVQTGRAATVVALSPHRERRACSAEGRDRACRVDRLPRYPTKDGKRRATRRGVQPEGDTPSVSRIIGAASPLAPFVGDPALAGAPGALAADPATV